MEVGLPPHDISAEEAVIAACLLDSSSVARTMNIIKPEDFFREQNGDAFRACIEIWESGEEVTIPTLSHALREVSSGDPDGWEYYLTELWGKYYTAVGVEAHARIVAKAAWNRSMIQAAQQIASLAWEGGEPEKTYSSAVGLMTGLAPATRDEPKRMGWAKVFTEDNGIKVGIPSIDKYLRGISPGKLTVLAGPSGQGKSMLAAQIAREVAQQGHSTMIVSMEMNDSEYEERIIRQMSGLVGFPSHDDMDRVAETQAQIEVLPLSFWNKSRVTLEQIRARATSLHADEGLDLIVIDYLQLMGLPNTKESEASKLGTVTAGLKQLATDLNLHIILLSQMNRGAAGEMRGREATTKDCLITCQKYPIPFIESLKGSGSIEQDADHVVFIAKHPNCYPGRHSSIVVAKNRHGENGECLMMESFHTSSFERLSDSTIYTIARGDMTISKMLRIDQGLNTEEDYD